MQRRWRSRRNGVCRSVGRLADSLLRTGSEVIVRPEKEELEDFVDSALLVKLKTMRRIEARRRRRYLTVLFVLGLVTGPWSLALFLGHDGTFLARAFGALPPLALLGGLALLYGWWIFFRKKRPMTYETDVLAPFMRYLHPRQNFLAEKKISKEAIDYAPFFEGVKSKPEGIQGLVEGNLQGALLQIGLVEMPPGGLAKKWFQRGFSEGEGQATLLSLGFNTEDDEEAGASEKPGSERSTEDFLFARNERRTYALFSGPGPFVEPQKLSEAREILLRFGEVYFSFLESSLPGLGSEEIGSEERVTTEREL